MKSRIIYFAVFSAVLMGGFFYALINTLTEDPGVDW